MDLPFTNIRQVLSLHNKVSPEKIFLTVISDEGREELSYAEFSARCHQTANFLQEDLNIEPADLVSIYDPSLGDEAVLLVACWLVGATVAFWQTEEDEESGRDKARFLHFDVFEPYIHFNELVNRVFKGYPLVQMGGEPTEDYPHFHTLVRGMPNSFFNDHPDPTRDTPAFQSKDMNTDWGDRHSKVVVTQGELLTATQKLTTAQVITGNQRLISYLPLSGRTLSSEQGLQLMTIFVGPLLVGGSIILNKSFKPAEFWREVAASRVHVACLRMNLLDNHIERLISFAMQQRFHGRSIYGEGVYQQDITQLRHIYCPDGKGHDDLIRQFTALFPFPVVTND
ncbi:MAG: AMP-binding protein [Chloroflexi bacterium]|nr:AMP-binding protein [Chloroflexota bacterium]MCC6895095.1 AMP-binding protein [Anaerolineae bacterium]